MSSERLRDQPDFIDERDRWRKRRVWRVAQVSCLPTLIGLSLILTMGLAAVTYNYIPAWVANRREYVANGRLMVITGTLGVLQILCMWGLGWLAAVAGSVAAIGQVKSVRPRLAAVQHQLMLPTLSVTLLRMAGLLMLSIWGTFRGVMLPLMERDMLYGVMNRVAGKSWPLLVAVIILLPTWWLAGPTLRQRYSMALGTLAATWSQRIEERISLALGARLAVGLASGLALLWGHAVVVTILEALLERPGQLRWSSFNPLDPTDMTYLLATVLTILIIYISGQITLPWLYLGVARRRLRTQTAEASPETSAEVTNSNGCTPNESAP